MKDAGAGGEAPAAGAQVVVVVAQASGERPVFDAEVVLLHKDAPYMLILQAIEVIEHGGVAGPVTQLGIHSCLDAVGICRVGEDRAGPVVVVFGDHCVTRRPRVVDFVMVEEQGCLQLQLVAEPGGIAQVGAPVQPGPLFDGIGIPVGSLEATRPGLAVPSDDGDIVMAVLQVQLVIRAICVGEVPAFIPGTGIRPEHVAIVVSMVGRAPVAFRLAVVQRYHQVVSLAEVDAIKEIAHTAFVLELPISADLPAAFAVLIQILAIVGDEVDDARRSIRTPQGRARAADDLDALDMAQTRQQVLLVADVPHLVVQLVAVDHEEIVRHGVFHKAAVAENVGEAVGVADEAGYAVEHVGQVAVAAPANLFRRDHGDNGRSLIQWGEFTTGSVDLYAAQCCQIHGQ